MTGRASGDKKHLGSHFGNRLYIHTVYLAGAIEDDTQ